MLTVFFFAIVQPKHKIQSSSPLQLHLVQCPKMMAPLVKEWIPQAFTVSFKVRKHFENCSYWYILNNMLFERFSGLFWM